MNRSQKKSLVASTGLHAGLLASVALLAAFQPQNKEVSEALPPIDFTPVITTDEMISGGGNPKAQDRPMPRPATAPQPQPQPAPPPPAPRAVKLPDPVPAPKETVREVKTSKDNEESLTPLNKPAKKPNIDINQIVKNPRPDKDARKERERERELAQARDEQRAWNEARARRNELVSRLNRAVTSIGSSSSSSGVSIQMDDDFRGPGGGGLPYANFLQAVLHAYEQDWRPRVPRNATDVEVTATATVTIARDGTVIEAHLAESSGNRQIDDSVRDSLHRVKFAAPLPATAKEDQRTITIDFNAKPKQLRG